MQHVHPRPDPERRFGSARARRGLTRTEVLVVALVAFFAGPARAANLRVSLADNGAQPNSVSSTGALSGDGRFVAFTSQATNLVAGGSTGQQLFVRDLAVGTTEIVSVSTGGAAANSTVSGASISGDGRYVAFESQATNLVGEDASTNVKVLVRDRWAGITFLASVKAGGGSANHATAPALSGNGRYVAFSSLDKLVPGDPDTVLDIYVRDLWRGITERVSIPNAALSPGGGNDGDSFNPSLSYDGRFIAFGSSSTKLVFNDTNAAADVFVRDRLTGATVRASIPTGVPQADGLSSSPAISWDGRWVAFLSRAPNLGAGLGNNGDGYDVFVRDLASGVTERVDVPMGPLGTGISSGIMPSISADGRFVTFASSYGAMAPGDAAPLNDVYLRDRKTGITLRASLDAIGADPNGYSMYGIIAPLGNMVAFQSFASNIVPNDTNSQGDVFSTDTASLLFPFRYQAFLRQTYRDLLERDPDAEGLQGWSSFLNQGGTRLELARNLAYSQEYRHLLVRDLYVWLLHRQADPGGENAWVDFLSRGGTIEQVQTELIASQEYFTSRSGSTNSGFIRAVYADLLNRRPDPEGERWFSQMLASGGSRLQMATQIVNSGEARSLRVRQFYQWLLRRDADPGGLYWGVDALNRGVRDEELIAVIVGSDEYFLRAQ